MEKEQQHPTLVITSPDGIVVKIYQVLSPEYIKTVLDEFLVERKLVK